VDKQVVFREGPADVSPIGEHANIYNLGPVTIAKRITSSPYAHLCVGRTILPARTCRG